MRFLEWVQRRFLHVGRNDGSGLFGWGEFCKDRVLANPSVTLGDTFPCRDGFERMGIFRVGATEIATLTLAMTTQGYSS